MDEFELVVRGGTVYDGTGADPIVADVGIRNGVITAVGTKIGKGAQEVAADGLMVTPGFIDVHTHYDGQVTWESSINPSVAHGVTTIITGNCGVGFAPCHERDHDRLVELMAGVEDIPEVVMTEGLEWNWTSFAEYLDAVDRRPHDVDIAAMVPHSALRVFTMGERAVRRENATDEDIAEMGRLLKGAIAAGAIGLGTSRAIQQRSSKGEPIPTVRAAENELLGLMTAMGEAGSGVFQALSDFDLYEDVEGEFGIFRRIVEASGRPMSFTLNQRYHYPEGWKQLLKLTEQANNDGLPIKGQVIGRPAGVILGHELTRSPLDDCPTYVRLAELPFEERMAQLRRPEIREQILAEYPAGPSRPFHAQFELTDTPNYEPDPSTDSIAARAAAAGVTPESVAYDVLMESGGHQLILEATQNYLGGSLDACHEMITHRDTVLGLGDGGAHLGLICDASFPTTMLAHWTRDRSRGPKISVAESVRMLSSGGADLVGLRDRGRVAVGYKADLNVLDYENIRLRAPHVTHDLPTGGRRILQPADGYIATIVSGAVTRSGGESTGAMPGHIVRGEQRQPALV